MPGNDARRTFKSLRADFPAESVFECLKERREACGIIGRFARNIFHVAQFAAFASSRSIASWNTIEAALAFGDSETMHGDSPPSGSSETGRLKECRSSR